DFVARVADEVARAADHSMARNDDRERVASERLGDGTGRRRRADLTGDVPVGGDGAIRQLRRHLKHSPLEVTRRQTTIGGPTELVATPFEVFEKILVEPAGLALVLHCIHAVEARQPGSSRRVRLEILDHRHAFDRAGDQDRAERRREDTEREHAASEVGQTRLQLGARQRWIHGRHRCWPHVGDQPIERTIPMELLTTLRTAGDVLLDDLNRRRRRFAHTHRHQAGLDLTTRRLCAAHRADSVGIPLRSSSPRRIFLSAWKTCARALSAEQVTASPIASYSSSCIFRIVKAMRCLSGSSTTIRSIRALVSWSCATPSGQPGATAYPSVLAAAIAFRRLTSPRTWFR